MADRPLLAVPVVERWKSRQTKGNLHLRGLVQNHSSGDPTPSQADIQMTKAIVDIATPLGISVHDHIHRRQERSCELEGAETDVADRYRSAITHPNEATSVMPRQDLAR